jgi:hypothetical protein
MVGLGTLGRGPPLLAHAVLCNHTALGQYTTQRLPKGYAQMQGDIITAEERPAELDAHMQRTEARQYFVIIHKTL